MWRQAVTAPAHRPVSSDNVTTSKPERGNSKAYTLDRLSREAPGLYERRNYPRNNYTRIFCAAMMSRIVAKRK